MRTAADLLGIHVCVVRTREASSDPQLPCTRSGIEYRQIETDELVAAVDDSELELDRGFVLDAIDRGDFAFGAFDNDNLIAYSWRSVTCAPHTHDLWVRVRRPYNYAYKSFTRPEYRGQRIIPSLILFSDSVMLESGWTHRVGFIAITNFASLEVGKHIESHVIGLGVFATYFGRCFSFRSKGVVKIGLEFFAPASAS